MNKADLINAVAEKTGLSKKDSEKAVAAVFASITESLQRGEKLSLVGFGTFEVKERAARPGLCNALRWVPSFRRLRRPMVPISNCNLYYNLSNFFLQRKIYVLFHNSYAVLLQT